MKNQKQIAELKGRLFSAKYYPTIKHIRTAQRQRIRQLLRSFIMLGGISASSGTDEQSQDQ